MAAGMASRRVPALDPHDRAGLGARALPAHRFPGHFLLFGPESQDGRPEEPGRGGPETAGNLRETGHSAARTEDAGRRGGGCSVRQRLRGDDVQGKTGGRRRYFLLVLRGGAEPPRPGAGVPGQRRPCLGQLLCSPELSSVYRRFVLLYPEKHSLPNGIVYLLPHQRGQYRAV